MDIWRKYHFTFAKYHQEPMYLPEYWHRLRSVLLISDFDNFLSSTLWFIRLCSLEHSFSFSLSFDSNQKNMTQKKWICSFYDSYPHTIFFVIFYEFFHGYEIGFDDSCPFFHGYEIGFDDSCPFFHSYEIGFDDSCPFFHGYEIGFDDSYPFFYGYEIGFDDSLAFKYQIIK